jgi:hypothetical protein
VDRGRRHRAQLRVLAVALGDLAKILAASALVDPNAPWGRLVDRLRI